MRDRQVIAGTALITIAVPVFIVALYVILRAV
jgi:hypothetical protein